MALEVTIPKLGMTMKEATIARWEKSEGERVGPGEVVLVIETEKITYEVESPGEGYLQILRPQGEVLAVGARVGLIFPDRASYEAASRDRPTVEAAMIPSQAEPELPEAAVPLVGGGAAQAGRVKASPLARKVARAHGIELGLIPGTGPGGRIVRDDVTRFLQEAVAPRPVATEAGPRGALRSSRPMAGVRKQIFQHMHRSLQETAQITLTSEVDATELVKLRESLKKQFEGDGTSISYNAILVRIVAQALKDHPHVNCTVDGDRILEWDAINIGVAMELEDGLIVPVVREADTRSIVEIERTLDELFRKARERKLLLDDIQGGSFTITNLGPLGIDAFTPILNRPESGILGVGRIVEKPVVSRADGQSRVEVRACMVLSLTVDHRIIDGAPGARFLRRVAEMIENPYLLVR